MNLTDYAAKASNCTQYHSGHITEISDLQWPKVPSHIQFTDDTVNPPQSFEMVLQETKKDIEGDVQYWYYVGGKTYLTVYND